MIICSFSDYPWYYKDIDELDAERLLSSNDSFTVGTFLVFKVKEHNTDCLSILGLDQVFHYPIYTEWEKIYLAKRHKFSSLEELVSHYRNPSHTLPFPLTTPCSKTELVKREDVKSCSLVLQDPLLERPHLQVFSGIMDTHQLVIAKTRRKDSSLSVYQFLAEVVALRSLQHNNIHQFICVTVLDNEQLCIISELVCHFNLKEYMNRLHHVLSHQTLFSMAAQIAHGMSYLESRKCILRNLAGKNVVLSGRNIAKISNFSRACFSPSGHMSRSGVTTTLRWTAPELLFEGHCSSKSDVWSFGITFWEILTYGSKPYKDFNSESIKGIIKSGYRIPLDGLRLPQKVRHLILECWRENPVDRPTFKQLMEEMKLIQDGSRISS